MRLTRPEAPYDGRLVAVQTRHPRGRRRRRAGASGRPRAGSSRSAAAHAARADRSGRGSRQHRRRAGEVGRADARTSHDHRRRRRTILGGVRSAVGRSMKTSPGPARASRSDGTRHRRAGDEEWPLRPVADHQVDEAGGDADGHGQGGPVPSGVVIGTIWRSSPGIAIPLSTRVRARVSEEGDEQGVAAKGENIPAPWCERLDETGEAVIDRRPEHLGADPARAGRAARTAA